MEKEENFDEIFDLKPILPEIYSNCSSKSYQTSDHGIRKANTKRLINSSISSSSCRTQETISHVDPNSSSSIAASTPQLISFENSNSDMDYNFNLEMAKDGSLTSKIINFSSSDKDDSAKEICQKTLSTATRTPLQALDHLMAERKRRENLSQLFISLSKVVPGLKKLDKASLLEDGINYLKALQERVRLLEEEEMKKSSMDTSNDDDSSSRKDNSIDNSGFTSEAAGPEIQARISDKNVLIKIFCKKQMGLMSIIPGEMEKIQLSVLDIRIMPFGGAALDITVLAEMQSEFQGTVKDIIDHLHTVFLNPPDNITKDNNL